MDKLQLTSELGTMTAKLDNIESKIKELKMLKEQYDDFRISLYSLMTENEVDKYVSLEGTQFTVVAGSPEKTEILLSFNENKFKTEHPDLHKQFTEQTEKITKARTSYLRITVSKEKEE